MTDAPPLEVHDLTVSYHKKPVLWGIDLVVPRGKLVGIVGPNGAGKSTLIKAAMGLLPLSSGWVKVFGEPVAKNFRRVGYVPQRESVDWDFPVSVMDVVLMGRYGRLGLLRRPGKADRDIARECLEKVKMLPYANRQISNLSGGQQQRVFLARALAQESDLYFMDEPFAGVDAATETAIIALLHELKGKGKTYGATAPVLKNAWNVLAVKVRGDVASVSLNGKALYDVEDKTFPGAGQVGLWTKADSVTMFDDLTVTVLK